MKNEPTFGEKMARKGRKKVVWKVRFILKQLLSIIHFTDAQQALRGNVMKALTESHKRINKAIQDAEMKESKPGPKGDKGQAGAAGSKGFKGHFFS